MKINVEIDLSPEELRRFMGLPDVQGIQEKFINQFSETLQSSADQRDEFVKTLLTNAMGPWQAFANFASAAAGGSGKSTKKS